VAIQWEMSIALPHIQLPGTLIGTIGATNGDYFIFVCAGGPICIYFILQEFFPIRNSFLVVLWHHTKLTTGNVYFLFRRMFPHMEFFLSHSVVSYKTYQGFIGVHFPVGQAPFHTPWYECLAKKSPDKNPP